MKAKITEVLKTALSDVGFNKVEMAELVDVVASKLPADATEEQISTYINGIVPEIKVMRKFADRLVEAAKPKIEPIIPKQEEVPIPANLTATPDFAAIIAEAVQKAVQPLQDKIAGFETTKTIEQTLVGTKTKFMATDWAKAHSDIADKAWKNAEKFYNVGGQKMSQEELFEEAKISFDDYASARGIEKPFEGDKGAGKKTNDFSEDAKILKEEGLIPTEKKE